MSDRSGGEPSPSPDPPSWPLEPDAAAMRERIEAVVGRVIEHLTSLPRQPMDGTDGGAALALQLRESMPEAGAPLENLLALLFDRAVPRSYNTAAPGYLAYIPGGGLFDAALAAFLADAVNRYVGVFAAAPALSQLEANVVAWFAEIVGFGPGARGFLTSGGSLANLTGIVTARRERLPESFLDGIIYVTDQAHHSIRKAALLAGFPEGNVHVLPSDERFRMRPEELARAVERDRGTPRRPFLVVASAGTTNTGAVDPLDAIADVAAREGLWLHVDAAYGGFFALTGRGRRALTGIERVDSIVLDPHKGLFLPYGSGCILVRDGEALRRAHTVRADYMPPMQEDHELVDFCEISPELSRGFRGLRVWLPVKLHGAVAFREALEEKLRLSDGIAATLRAMPDVEIVAEPQLTVTAWRWHPPGVPEGRLDALNQELLRRINARQRVYLTGTRVRGAFVIRICVLSFRTHADRMAACAEDIAATIAELGAER